MPLQLVRSALAGVTIRAILRRETFELINEALRAPEASFVIIAMALTPDVCFGGAPQLIYTDGQ